MSDDEIVEYFAAMFGDELRPTMREALDWINVKEKEWGMKIDHTEFIAGLMSDVEPIHRRPVDI